MVSQGQIILGQELSFHVHTVEHFTTGIGVSITGKKIGSDQPESHRLEWDAEYVVADPYTLKIDSASGHEGDLTVTFAGLTNDEERRPTYYWGVKALHGELLQDGADLYLGARKDLNDKEAMESLLSFLGAAAESYGAEMRSGVRGENRDLFNDRLTEWTWLNADELAMAALELEEARPDLGAEL